MLEHFGGEICIVAVPSLTGTSGSSVGRHAHLSKCDWKLRYVVCGVWEDGADKVQLRQGGVQPVTLEGSML